MHQVGLFTRLCRDALSTEQKTKTNMQVWFYRHNYVPCIELYPHLDSHMVTKLGTL